MHGNVAGLISVRTGATVRLPDPPQFGRRTSVFVWRLTRASAPIPANHRQDRRLRSRWRSLTQRRASISQCYDRPDPCVGSRSMRRSNLTMALLGVLACGGQENATSKGKEPSSDASNSGSPDATSAGTTSDAGDSGSPDAIGPVPCEPASLEAGATPEGDAEVPLHHRPTPTCCPAQRGPGGPNQPYPPDLASYLPPDAGGCTSDSQCTAGVNGRCFPFGGLVGPGGCSYDECFTDSNCGSKTPCLCRSSSTDNTANACDPGGNCAVDSDCGPGGYCSPSPQGAPGSVNDCYGSFPYFCHTASDLCINDADCTLLDEETDAATTSPVPAYVCAYNAQDNQWVCTKAYCALP
jgi:hypothetical protein